uniref:Putative secreted protein n=1 Tax=Anopheles darlingi TaxID=43151 RepID=A0A2M4DH80_ANODA
MLLMYYILSLLPIAIAVFAVPLFRTLNTLNYLAHCFLPPPQVPRVGVGGFACYAHSASTYRPFTGSSRAANSPFVSFLRILCPGRWLTDR